MERIAQQRDPKGCTMLSVIYVHSNLKTHSTATRVWVASFVVENLDMLVETDWMECSKFLLDVFVFQYTCYSKSEFLVIAIRRQHVVHVL